MKLLGWLRPSTRVAKDASDYSETMQRDVRLDDLTRERVRANVMAELACRCPCHERHDADLASEAFWR